MSFILYALATGLLLALVTGPLGCFVVWRRMAYFGDTLAHASLLGVALGLILQVSPTWTVVTVSTAVGLLLTMLEKQRQLAADTVLGILAHGTLAAGLIAISLNPQPGVSLEAFLLGDILTAGPADVIFAAVVAALTLILLSRFWRDLVMLTLHADLAQVEGIATGRVRTLFTLLLSAVIASAIKVVGVLLITALLIIPAAAARPVSRTPERMALHASLTGMVSVCLGLSAAWFGDWPAGPAIVLFSVLAFAVLRILPALRTPDRNS
ncbi:iron chelate uptake ABC transporter family permease subunit [Hahella sp. SMD15-11]|uniref:High-affinity zinc uptake system membrane protein ZnuB n=1 Tax=Thermohahella caldifontis TaxID=3142973 RepID=A0AB39UUY0_9GAMM